MIRDCHRGPLGDLLRRYHRDRVGGLLNSLRLGTARAGGHHLIELRDHRRHDDVQGRGLTGLHIDGRDAARG